MKYIICALCCSMLSIAAMAETHSNLQAVDNQGGSAWTGTFPFTIRGVITTPLDEMLDDTPNFLPWNDGQNSGKMGGEWEIFIQSIDENDRGGSLLWLGQNYGNQPWLHDEALSYTNEEWIAELLRVSTDPETGHIFQVGDYVEVIARQSLAYGGKRNINEGHSNNPSKDFDIHLIQANYGTPEPEKISLSDIVEKNEEGQTEQIDIFDPTRQSGGEYYQGIRVRIQGVQIATANGWDHTATWSQRGENSITDGDGRFLKVRYPRNDLGNPPTGIFDAVGIINQESGSSTDGTRGYELFLQEIILTDAETHSNLQAVDDHGGSAWTGTFPFTIRGVITTPLDEMLDDTPNFLPWNDGQNSGKMGAEWEIFIQSIDKNDRGGSLLWLGQNYGNQPWIHDESFSYTNEEWIAELLRVSTDPETGHIFQVGDYVEVTARQSLAYGGKRNINEGHSNDPSKDFDIHLIQANYGVPEPEKISLSDLVEKNEEGQTEQIDIFDPTRQSGGEYYQGIRVRIQGVQIATANGWDHTATWSQRGENSITDGDGRFLKVRYPRTDLGNPPTGIFDAVGIINQESGSSTDGTRGYELFLQEVILPNAETHSNLQAVDDHGGSAWAGTFPFTIRGVITTPLDEMLDDTPNSLPWDDGQNAGKMGAEWEIFIQSIDESDRGGSLLWLGQNYGNQPWIHDESFSYTNEEWIEELQRVSTDPETGHVFQVGDYVEVTARQSLAYGGKRNINEGHSNDPSKDFDIHLIQANYGVPEPEKINLSDIVEKNEEGQTNQIDIFDPTRQSGGEYYQGIRVRIQGVQIATANGWDHTGTWSQRGENSITDGDGRFLKVRYPRKDLGNPPTGIFDAVGIINQESGSSTDGTRGYELFLQEVILADASPSLNISSDGYISWKDANGEWILETTSNLQNEWTTSTETVEHKDGFCIVKVSLDQGTSYFRLRKSN